MGFSIGSFLGKIAGPVIGGLLGGPAGAVLTSAISAGFAPRAQPAVFRLPSLAGPTVRPAFVGGVSRAIGLGALAIGTLAEILFRSRENTGRPVSRKKIILSARVCGIALTAETFGLSETDVCTVIVSGGRRRGRGISAADLRRTRSTIRKVHSIEHMLSEMRPHRHITRKLK